MNKTLNTFKTQQAHSVELLEKLLGFIKQGEDIGVPTDPTLLSKVKTAIKSVSDEKLKVALIGGFSTGKTTIAAAWMERFDRASMKISHQESSDEVKVYEVDKDIVLIDTPGLFGFKEKRNAETQAIEKYKEITKKYVSEAHLILYVMDPTNPIKESHKDDLVWLFRTLNLLPRTIFVLGCFDEVADVADEQDYQDNLEIKRDNVTSRLQTLVGLNDQEIADLSIVAVAANPFDKGTEHWLKNIDQFRTLSHISTLQTATASKIQKNGGNTALIQAMHASVISDILNKQLPIAIENDKKIAQEVGKLKEFNSHIKEQLSATEREIENVRITLREFAIDYFSDLILQAQGCSLETFNDFFEREIGSEGIMLTTRLQNAFSRQTQSITLQVEKMYLNFDAEIDHFNTIITSLGKQGINYLLKNNLINKEVILTMRNGIASVSKMVGVNLDKLLKFKPGGATKLASGANGALSVLGLGLEVLDSYQQSKREESFRKAIDQMVKNFEEQHKELIELINAEQFKEQFFPEFLNLKNSEKELQNSLIENQQRQQQLQTWRQTAETIDAEFAEFRKST